MSDTKKLLIIGTSVIAAGAALYLLSREPVKFIYDPKKHTLQELRKLIHEIFVDGATLYCQKLNQMRMMKEQGEFKEEMLEMMQTKLK